MAFYKNYPHTFTLGKIGNLTIPNRIVMAPMGTATTGPDLRYDDKVIRLYEERAKGGVGMIITIGPGRQADAPTLKTPVAPSECPAMADPSVICRALTIDEIHKNGLALTGGLL